MNLLTTAKQVLRRPVSLSAITVGVTLLLWFYFLADPLAAKPIVARKMHIESIPMCE